MSLHLRNPSLKNVYIRRTPLYLFPDKGVMKVFNFQKDLLRTPFIENSTFQILKEWSPRTLPVLGSHSFKILIQFFCRILRKKWSRIKKGFCFMRCGPFLWAMEMIGFLLIFLALTRTNSLTIAYFVAYRFLMVGV